MNAALGLLSPSLAGTTGRLLVDADDPTAITFMSSLMSGIGGDLKPQPALPVEALGPSAKGARELPDIPTISDTRREC